MTTRERDQKPESYVDAETYKLPNDAQEHGRLDSQHKAIYALMSRSVHVPTLPDGAKILEIGCGTGSVSVSLALQNPTATVYGIDLSDTGFKEHAAPPNLQLIKGNILDLAGKDERFQWGSQDFIFSRLLISGIRDWPGYISTVAKLLKPGGLVEIQDISYRFYKRGDQPFDPYWIEAGQKAALADGRNLFCGEKVEGWMKDAGLTELKVHKYPWPQGEWMANEGREETRAIGQQQAAGNRKMHYHMIGKLCEAHMSEEEVKKVMQDCWDNTGDQDGLYRYFYATVGRKSA